MISKTIVFLFAIAVSVNAAQLNITVGGDCYSVPAGEVTVIEDTITIKQNGTNAVVGRRYTVDTTGSVITVSEETLSILLTRRGKKPPTVRSDTETLHLQPGIPARTSRGLEIVALPASPAAVVAGTQ